MRKFGIIMFSIISIMMITLLSISFSMRNMVVSTLSDTIVKEKVVDEITSLIYSTLGDVSEEDFASIKKEIENNENLKIITEKYFDSATFDLVESNANIKAPDITDEAESLLEDILKKIESDRGIVIPENQKKKLIDDFINEENLENVYNKIIMTLKNNDDKTVSEIVYIYNFFTNATVRLIFEITLALCIIFMFLLAKPKRAIMLSVGLTLSLSGILMAVVLVPLFNFVGDAIAGQFINKTNVIETGFLSKVGYIQIIISIILLVVYKIITKNKGHI